MISIVIPALNEERALPATLDAVLRQSPPPLQVVVADGGSADATRELARALGARVIDAPRGRATQMNAGARTATGDWLLFLHADTLLPAGALAAIAELPEHVEAGCFRQAFDDRRVLLRFTSFAHNLRCRVTRIMYGDQAMFVRRSVFDAVGGFPEDVLEDVCLSERLRSRARPVLLPLTVVTSARRFLAQGVVASLARVLLILGQHVVGARPRLGRRFFEAER